jgi:ribosomal-protein-alanine N-acetyltransferase
MIEIRTKRMILRPLHPDDRAEVVRVYTASWSHWAQWSAALEPGQTFDWLFDQLLVRTEKELREDTGRPLGAFLSDGTFAGFFALSNIVRGFFQSSYAGWRVNAQLLRRGYGLEGVTALLGLAFKPAPEGLGLHRVQANVIPSNHASLALAAKAGFRREGYAIKYLKIAGEWQDHIMMAKLAEEHSPQAHERK